MLVKYLEPYIWGIVQTLPNTFDFVSLNFAVFKSEVSRDLFIRVNMTAVILHLGYLDTLPSPPLLLLELMAS